MKANKQQIRIFHAILVNRGLMEMKRELVSDQSSGRTEHTTELDVHELQALINRLTDKSKPVALNTDREAGNRMRRRILSLCYTLGWTVMNTQTGKNNVDWEHLEQWMLKYSYLHKSLHDYTNAELPKLVTQFEKFAKTEIA